MTRLFTPLALAIAAAALAGCATTRTIDTDVQAFSTVPAVPPGATYRFERLPSQQGYAVQQDELERITEGALEKVGLKRDDTRATYSVQVNIAGQRQVSYDPWGGRPYGPYGWGGYGYGRRGYYGGWAGPAFPDRIIYQEQANLLVREISGGKVVYETHASRDGLQPADATVVGIMLDSALYGFPKSSQGVRRVTLEIPKPAIPQ